MLFKNSEKYLIANRMLKSVIFIACGHFLFFLLISKHFRESLLTAAKQIDADFYL